MSFKKILLWTILVLSIVTFVLLSIVYSFTDIKLSSLDGKGELIETIKSPDDKYQASTYVIYGNTVDKNQIRVSITDLTKKDSVQDQTVYWLYPANQNLPVVKWTSKEMLLIDSKEIDIKNEKTYYNWKKDKDLLQ